MSKINSLSFIFHAITFLFSFSLRWLIYYFASVKVSTAITHAPTHSTSKPRADELGYVTPRTIENNMTSSKGRLTSHVANSAAATERRRIYRDRNSISSNIDRSCFDIQVLFFYARKYPCLMVSLLLLLLLL